ncbi:MULTISPECIES: glycosyltransferase family 2 protein [unclassified Anabaena]|uniref:glycosyltransferase family 2 protein n=1 Tax=unclassified Anabaena TaxID=2619674 RepID=UPI0008346E8F|nr:MULTISPECIES: glycosyltransferase [unclassified Anabaena]
MPYKIQEIELTEPLPTVSLSPDETGIALIVRRQDKPIGFVIQALPAKTVLDGEAIGKLIAPEISTKLIQEYLQAELNVGVNQTPFPSITIAICTKDRPDNLARCLESLQEFAKQTARLEVLVVDNAPSDDRTQKLVESLPWVRYVREPKPGLDFARNKALQSANGEILAFLDDDVVVDRRWLLGLITAWRENPDAAAFTGLVLPYELETEAQILFESRGGFRRGFEKIRYGQIVTGNPLYPCGAGIFGAGCNMAFRREILLKIGGFDEALDTGAPLPGGGDLDIFYRVIRAGYTLVYEPEYLIYHQHRREYEKLHRQYWSWGLGFMAFVMKAYQTDPTQRSRLRSLILWWIKDQLKQLRDSWRGRHVLPSNMIWAELWGGIMGFFGEYRRSLKRIEMIRRKFS